MLKKRKKRSFTFVRNKKTGKKVRRKEKLMKNI